MTASFLADLRSYFRLGSRTFIRRCPAKSQMKYSLIIIATMRQGQSSDMPELETLVASAIWSRCCSSFIWLCLSEISLSWPTTESPNAWWKEEPRRLTITFFISLKICSDIYYWPKSKSTILMSFALHSKTLMASQSTLRSNRMPKSSSISFSISLKLP